MPENGQINQVKNWERRIGRSFAIIFLLIICGLFILNLWQSRGSFLHVLLTEKDIPSVQAIAAAEDSFDSAFVNRDAWINVYGGVQRLLGKQETDNFDVVKDDQGFLHMPVDAISEETLQQYGNNLKYYSDYCAANDISFLYVQAPSDYVPGKTQLPDGMYYDEIANDNIDLFLEIVADYGITYLDVRDILSDLSIADVFYKTDHHWAMPVTFRTFQEIVAWINNTSTMQLDKNSVYSTLDHYTKMSYEDSFLGSRGIRTGSLYAGKDPFQIYLPDYETCFNHEYYVSNEQQWSKTGDFQEVFVDLGILDDESYNNKYNALMYGSSSESRITNINADNDLHCLVIADSFGRQMVPFLSQCFYRTTYLDPQEGRYTDSYTAYLEEHSPDVVIVLFNGNSCYIPIPQ